MTVDGAPATKPATQVLPDADLHVHGPPRQYVSRGGHKLAGALDAFGMDVTGLRVVDAGISTGGFTDCLLQRGAAKVVGFDVGYGQVHDRLRRDDRVEVHERTNIRDVTAKDVVPPADLVVADLSFIALRLVLPNLLAVVRDDGDVIALVKPQFEADRQDVGKGGVVRSDEVWRRVLEQVATAADASGWPVVAITPSPITGPAGNVEFLVRLRRGSIRVTAAALDAAVAAGREVRSASGRDDGSGAT